METPAGYLRWGSILISIPNLLVIGLMIALFALALVIPLPGEKKERSHEADDRPRADRQALRQLDGSRPRGAGGTASDGKPSARPASST
jgi:hypothetical protein